MARRYNLLTVCLLTLTALFVVWAAIVFADPATPLNPWPRTRSGTQDAPSKSITSQPVTQLALVTLVFPTPLPTFTDTSTPTATSSSTPFPSLTPTPGPTTPVPTTVPTSSPAPAVEPLPSRTRPPAPPPAAGPVSAPGSFELGGQVAGFDDAEK